MAIVQHYISAAERKLRKDVAALSSALAQAKGIEEELEAAKSEIMRLNEELAGRNEELDRFQKESANLSAAASCEKLLAKDLATAKTEIARLTEELDVGRREQNRPQSNLIAAGGLVVDLKGQLNKANLLVDRLSKLRGVDKLIGAAAAQAHSGAEQDKAVRDVTAFGAEQDAKTENEERRERPSANRARRRSNPRCRS